MRWINLLCLSIDMIILKDISLQQEFVHIHGAALGAVCKLHADRMSS